MTRIIDFFQHLDYAGILGFITTIGGIYLGFVTFMDKAFGIKLVGNKVFKGIYNFFAAPIRLSKKMDAVNTKIEEIHNEVKYNGGKYKLVDAVVDLKKDTEQLIIGQSLLEANQMAFFDSSTAPMFMNDQNNELCYVNSAWLKLTGVTTLDEVRGIGWLKVIPKEDREELLNIYKLNIQNPATFSGKVRFINLQTEKITNCYCQTSLVRNSTGQIVKSIGTIEILD